MYLNLKIRAIYLPLVFAGLTALDQLLKYLVRYFGGLYVCNKNIAWSINIPEPSFWIFWTIIVSLLLFYLYKKQPKNGSFYLILILSGAVSNIIDRLIFGCVVDFIDLKFWPVFNLADIFIALGAVLLLAKYLKS
jgi:signal peptidase II